MKGKLITLYGINNIGKSTHVKLLCAHLKKLGYKAVWLKYPVKNIQPSGSFLNKTIRGKKGQKISEAELQLWFVINRFQFQPQLNELLKKGYIVVAEDYTGTGIAWGMAKGLKEKWLLNANEYLIKEDFAIMLSGKRTLKAVEKTHIHERNVALVRKSIAAHEYLAKKFGWKTVKLQDKKEDTSKIICKLVDDFLARR